MKRIAVLRGGPSLEYDISLRSGAHLISHLSSMPEYRVIDIVIDKNGVWYVRGLATEPHKALTQAHIDVVINALHGHYGEDGKIQSLLATLGIPTTGSSSVSSALSMNKMLTKKIYASAGIKTPYAVVVDSSESVTDIARRLFTSFPLPLIVKPIAGGSSIGVSIARDYQSIVDTLTSAFVYSSELLIEEYIAGKEITSGVVKDFRGHSYYPLIPLEVQQGQGIYPHQLTHEEKKVAEEIARQAHIALGLSHYSRTDMIFHPRRGVYALETNSLPGLTETSHLPKSLSVAGVTMPEFIDHIVNLALQGK